MKRVLATLLCSWCGIGLSQTTEELINEAKNTENVTTHGMGYDLKQYSPLAQINKSNVKRLVPIWTFSLSNDSGELSQPTIYNGVMYVINGNWTFAIDVSTGRQIWRTPVQYDRAALRVAVVGAINRGAPAIYYGKLFRVTVDSHVLALDMKTGKEVWKQKFAEWKEGHYATGAPLIANGVLISGMSGGESTTRGFLDGWDPDTGKKLWRRYTIPAPGEPGSETWPQGTDAYKWGGGPTWRTGSYDPKLDLVYWGTGNAAPYDPKDRGGMDCLYASSVLAIRPKTGELVWHYQFTPNDSFDFDGTDENVLADMQIGGQMRQVLINANKNGFLYVLDRTNGKLIAANPFVKVNWATHIDLATGRPVLTDVYRRFVAGEEVEVWPQRGSNAVPIAFNQKTGLVYTSSWNTQRLMKIAPPEPVEIGGRTTGVIQTNPVFKPGDVLGHNVAIDPLTGMKKWEIPMTEMPSSAGTLVTDGGLVFTGNLTGEFIALDEATGKTIWQFKTGSSINATPITYTHKGQQYVSVLSGLGGYLPRRFAAEKVPTGGSVWTFALMPE